MLTRGALDAVFQMYWEDMERCRTGSAYWSLLHVTVCLPDICAALQSGDARTTGKRYIDWCDQHLRDAKLTGEERYVMRCKVLHEGRATTGHPGRYSGFAFTQPAPLGDVDHRRVEGTTLVLDVGRLSAEYQKGVRKWIRAVEAHPADPTATHVEANLQTIVRVRQKPMPTRVPGITILNTRTS
jgi:hypothetical protein